MRLRGRRIAVLAENDYEDLEAWYPILRFREEGAEVVVVGPAEPTTYKSKHGYPLKTDANASTIDADSFDAVIVPGGWAPDRMRRYPAMLDLVRHLYRQGKVVAAICHGPWVLVSADVLRGKQATSSAGIKDDVKNAGATWINQEVVRDGNLITSRAPDDLPAFCREIIAALMEARIEAAAVAG